MNILTPFAHRRNPDASIDSICTTCFQTIASEESEGSLIAHEKRHSCDPYWRFSPAPLILGGAPSERPSARGLSYVHGFQVR